MSKEIAHSAPVKPGRIIALDYLRGFFIAVIVIDHLGKFPSLWSFVTGEQRLWMTAAEGFVIISGFLIGYIRGHKGLKLPFRVIAKKLFMRSLLLYLWMAIASIAFFALDWYAPFIPYIPSPNVAIGDWPGMLSQLLLLQHPNVWVHFLMLYAIFLFVSIGFIYLLRTKKTTLAVTLITIAYLWGLALDIEWMKWQIVFFIPALAGFYFPRIQAWWTSLVGRRQKRLSRILAISSLAILLLSIASSFFGSLLPHGWAAAMNDLFAIRAFGPARVLLSLLWFVALARIFHRISPFLQRKTFDILEYFGTHSLTAYITHGFILCVLAVLVPRNTGFIGDSLIGFVAILGVYGLIRVPLIAKIVPR